jgi:methylmalonyl-CoA mutase C-terminal domain/subunit
MNAKKKIRLLMAKHILDGHDRGIKTAVRMFRDAGMEVIYIIYRTPQEIIATAVEEDIDIIGLSFFSGAYFENVPVLLDMLKRKKIEDVGVVLGGLIPDVDIPELLKMGVKGVFGPGSDLTKFTELAQQLVAARHN